MRVELLTAPGCPHASAVKQMVVDCVAELGVAARIIEKVGRYPSPTVLINGIDVMRPEAVAGIGDACRLDLPTLQRVRGALRAHRPDHTRRQETRP
ncbi:thioredoxin domain-containing protein [Mycobacterium lacus]|uniref:Uncharacterized protein n=1 Tax=Mycobacterium lacus TaxID=169765 RepID=A0A1X1YVQ2_9MYCO|nr:alkylmercury lyase [Mycobacterium lacus]MCV7121718.1 alkylmercury lyase [Mycobacterium lacus]ORW15162.1 alkylmercury lyase [Mycobacterium lacus]BBX94970.1 hypothetical protein MLAC_02640 [Mycobacterium lacus]